MRARLRTIPAPALIFAVVIVLAVGLRLPGLDWPPLSDAEAEMALPALSQSARPAPFLEFEGASPPKSGLYQVLTMVAFHLFGAQDETARLIPAIIGVLLVGVPFLLRGRVGVGRASLTALLLTISPTLVASSRSVQDAGMGAFGLTLLLALLLTSHGEARDPWLPAIAIGVAISAGASLWFGLSGFLFAWVLGRISARLTDLPMGIDWDWLPARRTFLIGLLFAVVIATGAGSSVTSLRALFVSLSDWLSGWSVQRPIHPLTLLTASIAYEPLIWLLGLIGAVLVLRKQDRLGTGGVWWALGAILVIIIYPGRGPEHLIWFVIPMAYLGAVALDAILQGVLSSEVRTPLLALSGAVILLTIFAFLQIRIGLQGRFAGLEFAGLSMEFLMPTLALLLALALGVLFSMGWSPRDALLSAALSGVVLSSALSLSALSRLSYGESAAGAEELWRPRASTKGILLMLETIELVSEAETGFGAAVSVQATDQVPPALVWALRDYGRPSPDELMAGLAPSVVLAPETALPAEMGQEYIGQTLAVRERWGWEGLVPPEVLRWLVLGDAPTVQDRWVLMVRADVFGEAE